jgi:hypothetical protein
VSGDIDRFEVKSNFTVKKCSSTGGPVTVDINSSMTSHTLRGLNEDSSYTITVKAINTVGSTMATVTAETLASGQLLCA